MSSTASGDSRLSVGARIRGWRPPRPRESTLVAAAYGLGYAAVAAWLALDGGLLIGDAFSRVANAYYMGFSRDPHLAAVGFVWNPLPSALELPLLPLATIWPDLTHMGFAANVVSVLAMALAVRELLELSRELGLGRLLRLGVAALFALHPMTVYYAANGMSEGPFILFLLMAVRRLTGWTATGSIRSLALGGMALGLAYLCRYEALAAGLGAIGLVSAISAWRATGTATQRAESAAADAIVLAAPFLMCIGGWALASWLIVGNPFETFSSAYGNTAQVELAAGEIASATGRGALAQLAYALRQLLGIQPGIIAIGSLVAAVSLLRRDIRWLMPAAMLGGVLAFSWYALLTGKSFGWLRFEIASVPLAAAWAALALAGLRLPGNRVGPSVFGPGGLLPGASEPGALERGLLDLGSAREADPADPADDPWTFDDDDAATRRGWRSRLASAGAVAAPFVTTLAVLFSLAYALPTALTTMQDPVLSREESVYLSVVQPDADPQTVRTVREQFAWSWAVAAWLDPLHLPAGAVLADGATAFPLILRSADPRQFVITSDRDFRLALAAPSTFGVQYILVPPDCQALDAIRHKYPGLWETGAGFTTLAAEFPTVDGALGCDGKPWRLYRVKGLATGS